MTDNEIRRIFGDMAGNNIMIMGIIAYFERQIEEKNFKINELEIEVLGHGYALEVLSQRMGLPKENESYLAVLEEYQAIYNRCQQSEIIERDLKSAIIATLNENAHLADGDVCTLKRLKDAVPEWEANR